MWVGLLGPMEVRSSAGAVRITAPKLRSALAALTLRAGNVVPVEALAEAIWDEDWPPEWKPTIKAMIARIRKLLPAQYASRLVWRSPGYCLHLGPDESDLALFESLRKSGLAAASSGDWAGAARELAQALSLWRGSPLLDVESRLLCVQHAHYLERQRLVAVEARIEADIRLSRSGSAAVVPELERLAGEYPERERFHVLAMLALYRAGGRSEALGLYQRARRFLIESQGMEPTPDLRAVHERILAGDPDLLAVPLTGLVL